MILGRMLTVGRLEYPAGGFNGSTYLRRGATLTGAADSKQMTASIWFYASSVSLTNTLLSTMTAGVEEPGLTIRPGTPGGGLSGRLNVLSYDATGTLAVSMNATTTTMTTSTWHHVLIAFDASSSSLRHMYVDDVAQSLTVAAYNNSAVDWTTGNCGIGCIPTSGVANVYTGRLLDVWLHNTYLDISDADVRRKFRTSAGKPAIMGASGQNPMGSAPLVYFRDYDDFAAGRNRGTGGNFTVTGTVTEEEGPW